MTLVSSPVIGLIAGSGEFPVEIAASVVRSGRRVFVVGLRGFANRALRAYPHQIVDMLDPQRIMDALRAQGVGDVVIAGGVTRPGPGALLSIYSAFRNRDELRHIISGGDDRILRGVVNLLETRGFHVIGVDEIAPDLLARDGPVGALSLPAGYRASVARAHECLSALGRYDIGQALVIAGDRILAIEGPEGTNAMLDRVRMMRKKRRVHLGDEPALLVKIPKAGQDRRVDLPAIGPKTISVARAAGIAGIVIATGSVILVERNRLRRDADHAGLFVVGEHFE